VLKFNVANFYGPPKDGNYTLEYCVIEFWSGGQNADDFKCVFATTYDKKVAESLVLEDEIHRTWVATYRIYSYSNQE
jgi:hypothetical protein